MRCPFLALIGLAASLVAAGQTGVAPGDAPAPPGIQDNSFLVEEAYNQDEGIVQHIQQFVRDRGTGNWVYTFTQEWPVPRQAHQLSFSLAGARVASNTGVETGLGDLALNYRYQLVGGSVAAFAVAPRLSLLLPTGDSRRGLGAGGFGLQTLVPASLLLSSRFVAHGNAGATWIPRERNTQGQKAGVLVPNLGASLVWLARPTWNLLCETVWSRPRTVVAPGRTETDTVFLVNPGARVAWSFRSGLQIVGGVSSPIGVGASRGNRSLLLYLSFEHPFGKTGAASP